LPHTLQHYIEAAAKLPLTSGHHAFLINQHYITSAMVLNDTVAVEAFIAPSNVGSPLMWLSQGVALVYLPPDV
jgi:hypothetical protein